jgi:replication initiation and membrane attachment protein
MKNSSLFRLSIQSDLSAADFKVLALLYQPLLGLSAHSIYITFYQLLNKTHKDTYSHQEFYDLINIKKPDFISARNKLEAMNLLVVYEKDEHFLYMMKTPLTAKQFLVDTVFGSYLRSEIGEKNLNFIASLFKLDQPSMEGYANVTKSFDELYEFKSLNLLSINHPLQGRTHNGGSHIHYTFNYEAFIELIPERLKNSQLLTDKFKETINKIAFVYQFDISDMATIYENAAKPKTPVNFEQLNFKARMHYEDKHQTLTIKQKELSKPHVIDQVPPQVIIQKYAKTDQQGIALSVATQLLERNSVDPGIINVILMLVLKHKQGIMPNINYMEKVLHDWLSKGIMTTQDALNFSENLETKYDSRSNNKKKTTVSEPDWLDSYITDLVKME